MASRSGSARSENSGTCTSDSARTSGAFAGCRRRGARRRRHRPALQQVELSVGEGPLDVALGAVHPLAVVGQVGQGLQLLVAQAQRLHQLGRDVLVDGAAAVRVRSGSRTS